ncbi:histidine phosphatase family protein [Chondromyces crocatus]|nr:histidine phosphatase family protein [Chondromyces crocatus]
MTATKLVLIRHGQTDDNQRQVFQGHAGHGLNERGREQAARLAARLVHTRVHLDAIYASDLQRAHETASILGEALSLVPITDPSLREVNLGAWQGLSSREVETRYAEEYAAWQRGDDVRRGGGETYAELGARIVGAIDRIADLHRGGAAAVVSHGAAIKTFTALALGVPTGRMRQFQVPTNTAVCVFERRETGALRLVVWNDAAHLGDPLADALAAPLVRAAP